MGCHKLFTIEENFVNSDFNFFYIFLSFFNCDLKRKSMGDRCLAQCIRMGTSQTYQIIGCFFFFQLSFLKNKTEHIMYKKVMDH
jgi:hypothetical protein